MFATTHIGFPKAKFVVEIDGIAYAGFMKCSELSVETAKLERWEGGAPIPIKMPGRQTFPDITLERGASDDEDLFNWFESVSDTVTGRASIGVSFKRDLDIVQYNFDGSVGLRYSLFGAWPMKYVAGDWDNSADEYVIEKVTLCFDYWKRFRR